MLKHIVAAVGFALIGITVMSCSDDTSTTPGDPVTASAELDLKVKAQAGVTVSVVAMSNQMRQVMASNDAVLRKAVDADLERLHADVDDRCSQLIRLGDSQAAVERWLTRIGWPEFQALEAQYRKAGGQ